MLAADAGVTSRSAEESVGLSCGDRSSAVASGTVLARYFRRCERSRTVQIISGCYSHHNEDFSRAASAHGEKREQSKLRLVTDCAFKAITLIPSTIPS